MISVAFQLHRSAAYESREVREKELNGMVWTIVVILLVLWLLGIALKVTSGLIHILLVIALVVIVMRLLTGRRV
jgi:heme/copper-type cytochrome/quinol oxidase subunit 2